MCTPQPHRLGKGIEEDEGPVAIVNKLHETAIHHLITQGHISQQGDLLTIEKRHRPGIKPTADSLHNPVVKEHEKGIHPLSCRLDNILFVDRYLHTLTL